MSDRCRIMIVDDEFIMRQGIRYMMDWEAHGYQVAAEASNGKEALDLLEETRPHIILCDIAMPVLDGLDFIKAVHRKHPEIQIVVLSSYDRFDYVREALLEGAVDYVLKPTLNPQELLKIVDKAAGRIPGMEPKARGESSPAGSLERYLKGYDPEIKAWEFQELLPHNCFRLFALPMPRGDVREEEKTAALWEETEEFLGQQTLFASIGFQTKKEVFCVALNYPKKEEEAIALSLKEFLERMSLIYGRVFGALGKPRHSLEELKKDYEDPEFLNGEAFYHKGVVLYTPKEPGEVKRCQRFDFGRFSGCVTERRYEEAIQMLEEYIQQAAEAHMPEFKLKNQTKNLLYNLIGSVDGQIQELEEIRREYFDRIEKAAYCEEFLEVAKSLSQALKQTLAGGEQEDVYLGRVLSYMEAHYKEDLDLQQVAKAFNFNYSYLSAYFSQHMGEGFSEYLNGIRIREACRILREESCPIAQVSSLVGYSDHSYFCRVFKKLMGKTPSGYRRES